MLRMTKVRVEVIPKAYKARWNVVQQVGYTRLTYVHGPHFKLSQQRKMTQIIEGEGRVNTTL